MRVLIALVLLVSLFAIAKADLPVHCLPEQIKGTWEFGLTDDGKDRSVPNTCVYNQNVPFPITKKFKVNIAYPNIATDISTGAQGTWTLIYDQGFEIVLESKKYFAFFNFTKEGTKVISHCSETFTGWYHEDAVNATNWGCWKGIKATDDKASLQNVIESSAYFPAQTVDATFKNDAAYIEELNKAQSSWTAAAYPEFEGLKVSQLLKASGKREPAFRKAARRAHLQNMKKFAVPSPVNEDYPANFDWRNSTRCPGGCVTPVRNQASCGSCFAFSSCGMFEARVMVQTGGKQQIIFSPQDDVACDPYNQGCNGGFTYSVSKYGQDFGIATEECNPYVGRNTQCSHKCPDSSRTYIKNYEYVGGFYGAANEANMQQALYENGPFSVDFEVYRDFFNYRSGVYHHVTNVNNPDPHFEETNHAVLLVGWGITATNQKYWIVKNSWGSGWGQAGYFWILRGVDECGIESAGVQAFPIIKQ